MSGKGEATVARWPRPRLRRAALFLPPRMHLAALAAATLLLAFALFCAWQAWLIGRQAQAVSVARQAQQEVAQRLGHTLQARHARVDRALADPAVRAGLSRGDPAGRAAAARRVQTLLPQARHVQFFSPSLEEVLRADYQKFGYAKAAWLMQLKDAAPKDASRMRAIRRGREHLLGLARRVEAAGGGIQAYVWLDWPLAPLTNSLAAVDAGRGRVALRQGPGSQGMVLAARGRTDVFAPAGTGLRVAASDLWVTAAMPRAPIVLPRHEMLAAVLAGVSLILAGVLLWLRFRRRTEEEPPLSHSASQPPSASAAAASAAQPATAGAETAAAPAAAPRVEVDPGIFRAYDIRGVVGTQLTAAVARALGGAIGEVMREKGLGEIVVGRDGRLSGPELVAALAEGLRAAGVDVIDVGAVPTPLIYFAAFHFDTGSGVAVTGSHNPPDYNGFKIVIGGETLSEDAIADLCRRIQRGRGAVAEREGRFRQCDIVEEYVERVASDVQAERPLKVVADAGNGIAGGVAPRLLEAIGCEVAPLYCDVDGHFPNHHPDPSDPHNLEDLIQAVQATDADLGVAFDGDGDRLGVVTREGEIIYPDRLLMLFARDVLARNPGATIIYDVKCTGHLGPEVLQAGGSPLMWRTGHSLIKAKMRQTEAALAGEMSGHFFFRERWYGFDDGLYSAARLLEILAGDPQRRSADEIFATLPKGVSTPELKITMAEGENHPFIARFQKQAVFEGARLTTIDGVRADWPDGWGLVRASNTTPVLVLRFDAEDEAALARVQQRFREQLLALEPDLELPF